MFYTGILDRLHAYRVVPNAEPYPPHTHTHKHTNTLTQEFNICSSPVWNGMYTLPLLARNLLVLNPKCS